MGYPVSDLPEILPRFGALQHSQLLKAVEDIQEGFRTVIIFQQT